MKNLKLLEIATDADEARIRKGTQGPRIFKSGEKEGEEQIKKWDYGFKEGNQTNIPDYWIYNPTRTKGGDTLIVPLGCEEYEKFINENAEWLKSIGALHNLEPQIKACKRTAAPPRSMKLGSKETGERSRYPLKRRIRMYFNKVLYDELSQNTEKGKEFQQELNNRSIPSLMISPKDDETEAFIDRHNTTFSNDYIFFRTHSYNSYNSIESFLTSVVNRLQGVETEGMKTHHLARQFNNRYSNWDPAKKSKKVYKGKTPKYGLDVLGLEEMNLDLTMRMDFEIKGRREGDSFTWVVKMNCKFGKKAPQDFSIRGGLNNVPMMISVVEGGHLDDKNIIGTSTAQLTPEEIGALSENSDLEITSLFSVSEALRQAIYDFKEKVLSIQPESMIELGNITIADRPNAEMNESNIKKMVDEVIKKIDK